MGYVRSVIARDGIATKDDVRVLMEGDLVAAVRVRLPAYFDAVGSGRAEDFLHDMAVPLVRTLRAIAMGYLRDGSGSHLPPGEIDSLVASALTSGALVTRGVKEPR
jgi:hypothetical protein